MANNAQLSASDLPPVWQGALRRIALSLLPREPTWHGSRASIVWLRLGAAAAGRFRPPTHRRTKKLDRREVLASRRALGSSLSVYQFRHISREGALGIVSSMLKLMKRSVLWAAFVACVIGWQSYAPQGLIFPTIAGEGSAPITIEAKVVIFALFGRSPSSTVGNSSIG